MSAERAVFPARTAVLPQVAAFVERRCGELGASRTATLRLLLAAEELFVNAVVHGYGGDCDRTVRLAVRPSGRLVELVHEDDAPPFHPFRRLPRVGAGEPRERAAGGLGRLLVARTSLRQRYQRRGASNVATVAVARGGDAPRARKRKKKL